MSKRKFYLPFSRLDGSTYDVPYGEKDQCIYSVGRRYVNEILLTGNKEI